MRKLFSIALTLITGGVLFLNCEPPAPQQLSGNADLSDLAVSAGTLNPVFSPLTTAYTAGVANDIGSLTVTPTKQDAASSVQVRINGGPYSSVASGSPSGSLSLNVGGNLIEILVTAQNTSTKTYAVTVTRAASSNASLSGLTVSRGALDPPFAPDTLSYAVDVLSDVADIVVTGTAADAAATVGGDSGQSVALAMADNTVTITVTAQDAITARTYTVSVFRNGWDKWVQTDHGALDSDLTFTPGTDESVTIVCQSSNLMWSRVGYHSRMPEGSTYQISFTVQSTRLTHFLSVYENESSQFANQWISANTPTAVSYTVTPPAGADEHAVISFRPYPNTTTGYVEACTLSITNVVITK